MKLLIEFLLIFVVHNEILAQSYNGYEPILYKCSASVKSEKLAVAQNSVFTKREGQRYSFKLVPRLNPLSCLNHTLRVTITSSQESQFRFNHAGFLIVLERARTVLISPEKFCISDVTSEDVELHACPVDCSNGKCIYKCCPSGSVLSNTINGSVECANAPESPPLPILFSLDSHGLSQGSSTNSFQTQLDTESNDFFPGKCVGSPKVNFLGNDTFNDFSDIFVHLNETSEVEAQDVECIDHHFNQKDSISGRISWKVARVSCNIDVDLRLRSSIKSVNHFSLYKCPGKGAEHVSASFVRIPPALRLTDEKLLDNFKASTSYTSLFDFNLVGRHPNCIGETFELTVSAHNNATNEDNKTTRLNFTADGYIVYLATSMIRGEKKTDEIYIPREDYCISRMDKNSISVRVCKSKCSHRKNEIGGNICIPKCCYLGTVMSWFGDDPIPGYECSYPPGRRWLPDIYKNELTDKIDPSVYPLLHYNFDTQIKTWNCNWTLLNDTLKAFVHGKSEYRILADGRVVTRKPGVSASHMAWEEVFTGTDPVEFCIDGHWNTSKPYDAKNSEVYVYRCSVNKIKATLDDKVEQAVFTTKILFFLVYLPCAFIYLLILLVYVSIWEKQNVQGWTVMAFAMSQLLVYFFLLVLLGFSVFGSLLVLRDNPGLCVFTGFIHYFFLISTFTWTLVLTFDVWAKLSSMTPTSHFYKGTKRFLGYTCFAVGVPAVVAVVAIALEFSYNIDETEVIIPRFRKRCLISDRTPFLLYVVVVNSLLFATNLLFGFLTFRSLWEAKKNVSSLKTKSQSTSGAFENKFALVSKLMMLMGFVLIFEVFLKYTGLREVSVWFNTLESYRLFHAIGLFWIFVCSDKTTKQLQEKYPESSFWSVVGSVSQVASVTPVGTSSVGSTAHSGVHSSKS